MFNVAFVGPFGTRRADCQESVKTEIHFLKKDGKEATDSNIRHSSHMGILDFYF
jgi:hypothetical protein